MFVGSPNKYMHADILRIRKIIKIQKHYLEHSNLVTLQYNKIVI